MAVAIALLALPAALAAPKTDVVVLFNGDRITGEIKGLTGGQLRYGTDDLGTIYIEWDKISRLTTQQVLRLETREGSIYVGSVPEESEDRKLRLIAGEEASPTLLSMDIVVSCKPLDTGSFLHRLDGSVSVGYDFTKSTGVETFNASFELRSKSTKREWSLSAFANISDSDDSEASEKYSASGSTRRLLSKNHFFEGFLLVDSNSALALKLRGLAGGAYGAYLVRSNVAYLTLAGGAAYSHESFSDGTTQNSIEGVLGLAWDVFVLDTPKRSVNAYLYAFPSLSDRGRYRADTNIQMSLEIVKDFFFELSFYGSYDNQAVEEGGETLDYGVVSSIGYSF